MPAAATGVDVSQDGQFIFATGIYKPRVRCYDVAHLSMKFERCVDAEVLDMTLLSEDYAKVGWRACKVLCRHVSIVSLLVVCSASCKQAVGVSFSGEFAPPTFPCGPSLPLSLSSYPSFYPPLSPSIPIQSSLPSLPPSSFPPPLPLPPLSPSHSISPPLPNQTCSQFILVWLLLSNACSQIWALPGLPHWVM